MTPHEWEQMIKGARHRRVDQLEDSRLLSIMVARLSAGKDIKKITKSIQKERALINQSENSFELEQKQKKEEKKRIRAAQRKAFAEWLSNKNNR